MQSIVNILNAYGLLTVEAIKNDIDKVTATGKTKRSIRFKVTSEGTVDRLIIYGRPFTDVIETGRGPRKASAKSDFEDNLIEWVRIRFPSESGKKQLALARFFRWKINKEGDRTYKLGGKQIYSDTIEKAVKEIKAAAIKDFRINFSNFVKSTLSGNNTS